MKNFRKTKHFLYRQWDRGLDELELRKILDLISRRKEKIENGKTFVFVGEELLKKTGIKLRGVTNLVIIIKENRLLVTLFFIEDFWKYFKSRKINNFILLH